MLDDKRTQRKDGLGEAVREALLCPKRLKLHNFKIGKWKKCYFTKAEVLVVRHCEHSVLNCCLCYIKSSWDLAQKGVVKFTLPELL